MFTAADVYLVEGNAMVLPTVMSGTSNTRCVMAYCSPLHGGCSVRVLCVCMCAWGECVLCVGGRVWRGALRSSAWRVLCALCFDALCMRVCVCVTVGGCLLWRGVGCKRRRAGLPAQPA